MDIKTAIKIVKDILEDDMNGLSEQLENALQTLLSVAKQQEVGSEEIEEIINKHEEWLWTDDGTKRIDITKHNKILANSLKDKFIITRR